MKKLSLLIFINLLVALSLSAQTSFYAADVNQTYAEQAIVRSWDNGKAAITYYEVGLDRYVQYVNYSTGDSYRAEVPDYLQILDMYILDDTVYYCGYSVLENGGRGVVGYFDPTDFYSIFGYVRFRTLPVAPLTHVRKLVVQKTESGAVEAIAIGEHQWFDSIYDTNGHVIQMIPRTNRHFLFCRNMLNLNITYDTVLVPDEERYYDVLLTDNNVVFVGAASYLSQMSVCIRSTERHNTFPYPTWPLYDVYIYPIGGYDVFSATHSTAMNKDSIAVSYMHINPNTGDVSNRIRVFDIAQMAMVYSQEYLVSEKSELKDIVFIPDDRSLVALHDFKTPTGSYHSNFVYIDPYAINDYNTYIEYIKDNFFKSMTRKETKHYLATYGMKWFLKNKTNTGPYLNPECPDKNIIEVFVLGNVENLSANIRLNDVEVTARKYLNIKNIETRYLEIICENP